MENFPSFSEGLSLRGDGPAGLLDVHRRFPFLFGGTFIEGQQQNTTTRRSAAFPFLFGGTFIEGPR